MPKRVLYLTTVANNEALQIWSSGFRQTRSAACNLAARTEYPVLVQVEKYVLKDRAFMPLVISILSKSDWYDKREIILKKHGKKHDLRTHNR